MNWFKDSIVSGLQMLFALRLKNAPASETATAVAKIWIATISSRPIAWDEKLDAKRIKKAFTELAATSTHWPAPADLIRLMPPRENQLKLDYKAKSTMSPESREMLNGLMAKLKVKA